MANAVHAARIWADSASASAAASPISSGGLARGQVAEHQRHVEAVAGAEDTAQPGAGQVSS